MCTKDQYDSWASDWDNLKADSILYQNYKEKFVTVEEAVKYVNRYYDYVNLSDVLNAHSLKHDDAVDYMHEDGFMTCDDYDDETDNEFYYDEFVTPGGETVVAFGCYGWDC